MGLRDLSNYKDLKSLESSSISVSFTKDEMGITYLTQQSQSGFFSKPLSVPVYTVICAFHGSEGENGAFQGVCEQFNIPYTGSGVLASSIGMDKVKLNNCARQITSQLLLA